tara:strand:- start:2528 stop:4432 length:1905 start_codon:yes stop_codon:yes gene_type:complete
MFLQAGGETSPEAAMLQEAEAGAMAQGQQLGEQYAQQMMQGIDQAQSTEDLINALRGNEKPLDARRSELAGFVGQNDANETPESVLAMVQPVIMMTEEGVMDSGIGGLVQQIVGDVEMTTDSGAPTDMGMGVGSLMAAGAQEAPTPQNFRQGGEVAHLFGGSGPLTTAPAAMSMSPMEIVTGPTDLASENMMSFGDTVKGYYDEMLPLYKEILGQDDASREATKSQMLFDIAQGGLALAAGVPGAGSSFASQLAGAAAPVAAKVQERGAALRDREDRLKAGALETALGRAAKDAEYEQMMDLAEAKAGRTKPELRIITDLGTGKKVFVDINTPKGAAAVQQAGEANAAAPEGNLFSVNTVSSDSQRGAKAFMIDGVPRLSLEPGMYLDTEGMNQKLPPNAIPLPDERAYDIISTQARRDAAAEQLRTALGGEGSTDAIIAATVKGGDRGAPTALTEDDKTALTQLLVEAPDPTNPVTAAQEGTGLAARFGAALDDIYGGATGTDIFQDLQSNRQYLKGIRVLGRSALVVNPRFPVAEMENVAELFPDPDSWWVNPTTQANKLIEMKRLAQQVLLQNLEYISNSAPSEMIADIEANNRELERLLSILKRVPDTYDTNERQTEVTTALRNALKNKR